ncbi:MAG: ATP-binding protein [Pirellulaceae bacterium]
MSESTEVTNTMAQLQLMMGYAAELELEIDRLRRCDQFLQHQARDHVQRVVTLSQGAEVPQDSAAALAGIADACRDFDQLLRDMREPPGYQPSFDQVVNIPVRALAEYVFRWQQRLSGASEAVLRLDLCADSINWFPARLHHILDNLISNSLRYRDTYKGEIRVGLQLRAVREGYELRLTDNGVGISEDQAARMLELSDRALPPRSAGLGVGLAVVKMLVEQCCGTIAVSSSEGRGTSITVVLPRYDLHDHVEEECFPGPGVS